MSIEADPVLDDIYEILRVTIKEITQKFPLQRQFLGEGPRNVQKH